MDTKVFSKRNILIDTASKTQTEAFRAIANFAASLEYVMSADEYFEGLIARESETTTGFKNGIAIPHSNDESVIEAGLFLIKFENGIEWNSLDGKPVHAAFALTIPKDGSKEHLKLLSLIARKLMDDKFTQSVMNETDSSKLASLIAKI